MKFILNENSKFLLEERFILQEASMAEVAQTWTDQLLKSLENAQEVLAAYLGHLDGSKKSKSAADAEKAINNRKPLINELKTAGEAIENSLSLPADKLAADNYKALKAEINAYGSRLRIAFQETNGKRAIVLSKSQERLLLPQVNAQVKALTTLGTKTTLTADDITDLKEILEWCTTNIEPLFDVTDQEDTVNTDQAKLEKFKKSCQECIDLIKDLQVDLPDDFMGFSTSDLKTYQGLVQQALTKPKLKNAEAVRKNTDYKQELLDRLDNYQAQVDALLTNYRNISKSAILTADLNQDWKTKYADAQNKEAIIEEFIYTVWKNDYDEVLKIKKTLLQECDAYGFNTTGEQANPFISFISNVYLKYKLSPDIYNVIHNLVVHNKLAGKDLAGKGAMGFGNLIFCRALYVLGAEAIKQYIIKQSNLLEASVVPEEFNSAAEMTFNALYKLSTTVTGEQAKNSADLSLRPMNEVEQLEAKWTGKVSDVSTKDTGAKNPTASNAALLKQIDSTDKAVKVLVTMALKFNTNDEITQIVKSCTEAKQLMEKVTTLDEIQKMVASIERLYKLTQITATQALNLVKSILDSEQFNLKKE